MMAAQSGVLPVVQVLLSHGARINRRDAQNRTALWYACERGHMEVAQRLVEFGADPTALRSDHTSCLMVAAQRNRAEIASWIPVETTALQDVDFRQLNAMGLAAREGNDNVLRNLLSKLPKSQALQCAHETREVALRYNKDSPFLKVSFVVLIY